MTLRAAILIPARDEADALPLLFEALGAAGVRPGHPARRVLVVDNGSRDGTAEVARAAGARVVLEPRPGYGQACLAGLAALAADPPEAVVFLDADDVAAASQLGALLEPLASGEADMAIGERGGDGAGGVRWHARLGNHLVLWVMRLLYGSRVRDMGPFRAVRWTALAELALDDRNYGWYVQMQVRALRAGHRVMGVPVRFERRRAGRSKVSGSWLGSLGAGWVMLRTLAVEAARREPRR